MAGAPNSAYPPTGTVQMNQLQAGKPNAVNTQPPPNPLTSDVSSFPSDQNLNSQLTSANQNLVSTGTADTRQQYITNSNIPAMQSNYDDLARQLFEYDQGKLAPQFQGQNPGTPADAASFGRVEASPLGMTVGSAGLPASQGIFNNNPRYAYTAQTEQANSLSSLLDTLNKGIGSTLGARIGTYKSDRQAAQDAVDTIIKEMGLKSNLVQKQAELQSQADLKKEELQNQKDIESMRLGLTDAKGNPLTGVGDLSQYKTKADQASYLRDLYTSAQTPGERKRISDTAKQMGISLTPTKPSDTDTKELGADIAMIQKIQSIINVMDQHKKDFPSGYQAQLQAHLAPLNMAQYIGGHEDVTTALADINSLKLDVERLKGGVRAAASPQMYNILKSATIDIGRSPEQNKTMLNNLLQTAQNDLKIIAHQNQYTDVNDMMANMGIPATGMTNSSTDTQNTKTYNGSTYTKVQGGWQKVK